MKKLVFTFVICLSVLTLRAQEIVLKDVVTDTEENLSKWMGTGLAVIVFVKQDCPYDIAYTDRLNELANKNTEIKFMRVNASRTTEALKMREYYSENSLAGPYLFDDNQELKKKLKARKSTETFLVQFSNNKMDILYHGAIDSNPLRADDVREHYLEVAIEQALNGNPIEHKQTAVTGCSI